MLDISRFLPMMPWEGPPLPRGMKKEWPKPTEAGEIHFPKPPAVLSRLPFESQVDKVLDKVNEAIRENPITKAAERIYQKLPKTPAITFPTPLGEVKLPAMNPLPPPMPPQIDARRKDILKASLGVDLASIPGYLVPVIGDYIEEEVGDLYMRRMKELMTPEEFASFQKFDAVNPLDTLAAWRALMQTDRKRKGL